MYILGIYKYIPRINHSMYHEYSWYITGLWPPAQPTHGLEDNVPDVHDEADFDIPYTQAVLERFMTHMSKLAG